MEAEAVTKGFEAQGNNHGSSWLASCGRKRQGGSVLYYLLREKALVEVDDAGQREDSRPVGGEDFTDNYGYEGSENLVFEVHDYDKGSKSELLCKAVLPCHEFDRPKEGGGFDGLLPLELVDKSLKGYSPVLKIKVYVVGQPVPPPRLRIGIIGAKGLPPSDPNGKSDPFCSVMIIGKPYSKSSTRVITKSLDPHWQEELSGKYRYEDGDNLIFEVRDYDGKGAKCELLGRAVLENNQFHKMGGYVADLPLQDVPKGQRPPDGGGKFYTPYLQLNVQIRDFDSSEDNLAGGEDTAPDGGAAVAAANNVVAAAAG